MQNISTSFQSTHPLPLCHLSSINDPGGLEHLLMVLLHHHLEAVAQIDLEAQKVVAVEMEEDEKPFPHMGSPSKNTAIVVSTNGA
jgi:hypothetical protein